MPVISIIIPVYNSEKYISKCLDSVFSQTFDDFEVIIVNDGSRDSSQCIIDAYKAKFPDKITAIQQENSGQASARNRGLDAADGDYIIFVDSDDFLHPEALEKITSYAEANELDIVCFNISRIVNGSPIDFDYRMFSSDDVSRQYLINEASPCNKLIRRDFLNKNNLRFTVGHIYEDLELVAQFPLHTDKIGFMDDRLYYYVIHENSTMQQPKYSPKLASIYAVMDTLKEKLYNTEFRPELECIFIEHLLHCAVLRYLIYPEGKADVIRISRIMKNTFPKWYKNKYYKTMGIKYKIVCTLAYLRQYRLLKFILKI
ncbi:MAG: glycosyltransferase [Ruminococcaceae bacterium]|nr:glycosyltransferase [Oscillospiraceae bacterium]